MIRVRVLSSLRARAISWAVVALLTGMVSAWLWMSSQAAWRAHLDRAYETGLFLYQSLGGNGPPPPGITITPMEEPTGTTRATMRVQDFPDLPSPALLTSMSIISRQESQMTGERLQLHVVSRNLRYPLARLPSTRGIPPAAQLGELVKLMASYCDDPILIARFEQGKWQKIEGPGIWGCSAAPTDMRLVALAVLVGGMIFVLARIADTSSRFRNFAETLASRGSFGGKLEFKETGPDELRDIARALNEYVSVEQDRLEKRALVLSGVSHDLGTPATRLRLRSALIEDEELRARLNADIDQMTGMIESVLTYTRSEMNAEEPRRISLTALLASIVADYEDTGKPVTLRETPVIELDRTRSVFGGGGMVSLSDEDPRRILVTARPVSLERAINNLIDNALKYGRRATVYLKADSMTASIIIEDEGGAMPDDALPRLIAPFVRGENASFVKGSGLGLTIVSTIALQHGGALEFESWAKGTRAILKIRRT